MTAERAAPLASVAIAMGSAVLQYRGTDGDPDDVAPWVGEDDFADSPEGQATGSWDGLVRFAVEVLSHPNTAAAAPEVRRDLAEAGPRIVALRRGGGLRSGALSAGKSTCVDYRGPRDGRSLSAAEPHSYLSPEHPGTFLARGKDDSCVFVAHGWGRLALLAARVLSHPNTQADPALDGLAADADALEARLDAQDLIEA